MFDENLKYNLVIKLIFKKYKEWWLMIFNIFLYYILYYVIVDSKYIMKRVFGK